MNDIRGILSRLIDMPIDRDIRSVSHLAPFLDEASMISPGSCMSSLNQNWSRDSKISKVIRTDEHPYRTYSSLRYMQVA